MAMTDRDIIVERIEQLISISMATGFSTKKGNLFWMVSSSGAPWAMTGMLIYMASRSASFNITLWSV